MCPAEFESGFFGGRQPAWHGLGTVIDDDVVTGKRGIKLAGLDWLVRKIPLIGLYGEGDDALEIDIPESMAVVREDTKAALGTVGSGYELFQNEQLFELVDAIMDTGDAKFHTAGSLKGGRHVWALARLVEGVTIAGDEIEPYLLLTNAHDGTRALTAVMTPIRVVCKNTLNAALRGAIRTWAVRHTGGIHERAREARDALGIAFTYTEALKVVGEKMASEKMTKKEVSDFLVNLIPYPEDVLKAITDGENGGRARKNVDEARAAVSKILKTADDLDGFRDRQWGAWNAVAEYVDHGKEQRTVYLPDGTVDERTMNERRFVRVVIDNDMKQRALRMLNPDLASKKGENLELLNV